MTPVEAKEIIERFHHSIKDMRPNAIVQSNKELPYTQAKIRYAHFVYGEDIIKRTELTEEMLQELQESYGIIDSLFVEEPGPKNAKYRKYLEGLRNGIITGFRMPNPFGECEPVLEYHNFLGEYWLHEYQMNLFTGNPAPAFIYEAVRDKATKEHDIKTLIEMVNSSLTRAVRYPGKKSNAESTFI
jgi:hypothetical protein